MMMIVWMMKIVNSIDKIKLIYFQESFVEILKKKNTRKIGH